MQRKQPGPEELRNAALRARVRRPLLELGAAAGFGLLALGGMLLDPLLQGSLPLIEQWQVHELLLLAPVLHAAVMTLLLGLLRLPLERHFTALLAQGEQLLWIVSGELPPGQSRLAAALLGPGPSGSFNVRLARSLGQWRALCESAGSSALPVNPVLRWWPVGLALGWTAVAGLFAARYGFNPLLYPVFFVLLALHLLNLQAVQARDEFTVALCSALLARD